jgi:GTP cyclohydrolase II
MTGGPHWIAVHNAMHMIGRAGRGVVVLIREHRPTALAERVAQLTRGQPPPQEDLRDYGIGAQILLDLGVSNMILLSNRRRTIIGLDGYGLNVIEQRPIEPTVEPVRAGPVPAGPVPAGPVPAGPVPAGPVPAGPIPTPKATKP